MDIQKLIDEVVEKLTALYAALGSQRVKVGLAITALTGSAPPSESGNPELEAAAQAAITGVHATSGKLDAINQSGQ